MLQNFKGIFVTDGYSGYNAVPDAIHAECWSHARRKYLDSIPTDNKNKPISGTMGEEGLKYINSLFEIERDFAELPDDKRLEKRKELSKPIYGLFSLG